MINGIRRSLILQKTTKILAGKNIPVHMEGFKPRVEYNTHTKKPVAIYIPHIPPNADAELVAAIDGLIDHESAHVLMSDPEDICDQTKNDVWHFIHNCIEDARINTLMAQRYPGCDTNLRRAYAFLFARGNPNHTINMFTKEAVEKIVLDKDEDFKFYQYFYAPFFFAEKMKCFLHGDKYTEMGLSRVYDPLESVFDPAEVAKLAEIKSARDVAKASDYFAPFFQKIKEDATEAGKGKGDKPRPVPNSELDKDLEDGLGEAIEFEVIDKSKKAGLNWHFSNRWDKTYTRKHIKPSIGQPNVARFETETATITNFLTRDLRRLLESRRRAWWVGGYKSGKLNQKALYSARAGNDRVFARKSSIRGINAAVSLLIDLSGSMSQKGKVEMACQSAFAFAMVLEQLRIPFEIWGFTTGGVDKDKKAEFEKLMRTLPIELYSRVIGQHTIEKSYAFKQFDENFDWESKAALTHAAGGGVGMSNNEDSWHVKAALERLAQRPEENKTLFIFSDGKPAYSPGNIVNTQEMLKYLDRNSMALYGAEIYSIGILDGSVRNYYKKFAIIDKLSNLPEVLFSFLRSRI